MSAVTQSDVSTRYQDLLQRFKEYGRVLVAFSGGVDSALVAYAAHDALGDNMLAVTAVSPSYPDSDRRDAQALVERFGFPHRTLETDETQLEEYQNNLPNRCYFCKSTLYSQLQQLAKAEGYTVICDGTNADDFGDHRPGRQAAESMQVRSPLAECGLRKDDVRAISRWLDLPTWDKPAMACLASRFAYGQKITDDRLRRVGACEALLHEMQLGELRVRFHGEVARIEVNPGAFDRVLQARDRIVATFKKNGFSYVTLDLEGFRSGAMNEVLHKTRETDSTPPSRTSDE